MIIGLKDKLQNLSKPHWQSLLSYTADLHGNSIHSPFFRLPYQWEEIAPGANLGFLFGNWDTVHMALDTLSLDPKHAMHQIMNSLALQQEDGLIPGSIALVDNQLKWSHYITFPPLWPFVVQDYVDKWGVDDFLRPCFTALLKQIHWFEKYRQAEKGFYYVDRLDRLCESGVKDGVRFDFGSDANDERVCVDTTSHVYGMYTHASRWAELLKEDPSIWAEKKEGLRHFIQNSLFDNETGFFHDLWVIGKPKNRMIAFEGIWPLVMGSATYEQAQRVINENLLEPSRFFTNHPIPAIGIGDPHFEYRNWRGPTRNSMTYWAARGCLNYERKDAACALLERALDATTKQFEETGKIWEFYHPQGGDPLELSSELGIVSSPPIGNYLGHNPLIAMALLFESNSQL